MTVLLKYHSERHITENRDALTFRKQVHALRFCENKCMHLYSNIKYARENEKEYTSVARTGTYRKFTQDPMQDSNCSEHHPEQYREYWDDC